MKQFKKINWMQVFLFLLPIFDFLSFLNPVLFFIGWGVKGIFALYAIFYLLKNTKHKKIFEFLSIYFLLFSCYCFTSFENPWLEITSSITIFSLPLLILFFSQYENEKITKKSISILFLFYSIFYLFMSLFKIETRISLIPVFILLFSIAFHYLIESNCYLLKGLYLLVFLLLTVFIRVKTFYFSLLIMVLYTLIVNRKKILAFCKKNQLKALLTVLVFCLFFVVYMPERNRTENVSFSIKEIFSYNTINTVFSGRLDSLNQVQNVYKNSESLEKVFGLGIEKLENTGKVESGIFDLFYSIGILGLLFYFVFFLYVLGTCHLKKNYKFTFVLLLVFSFLENVLVNPYVIPLFALLFLVSKNDHGVIKKDVLFVSNMYPNEAYPHYGIFVKNTYDLLKSEHSIDLVVMYKTNGKIKKFISYVKMCSISLLKAVFNNYDYIYVHFVSHTPAGVFLPAITSKNTKFVLNVHGNDLVADTDVDKCYLKLTRIFLKGADIAISPSKYFESILEKEYHIPKEKIVVYPSGGVDVNKFKKINKKTALKNAGLDSQYKYFGYVARLEKDKGYDIYIQAIKEFQKNKEYDKVRFLLVGSGSEEEECNALIKKYKLERIIIRKPLVNQEELINIYNALEALVYPTRMKSESLGLTGLEAMACETLVVGSNKFGPSDYLIDNENSLTFHPNRSKELLEKMNQVLKMKASQKNQITKNARKKSEEYSSEVTKGILLDIFKRK